MPGTTICNWDELPAEGAPGTLRRAVQGRGATVKRIEIPAGTSADRHSHPHEQFVMVLEGTGTLACDAGEVKLRPGTVVHFEPDAWHSAVFDTRTVLMEVNLRE